MIVTTLMYKLFGLSISVHERYLIQLKVKIIIPIEYPMTGVGLIILHTTKKWIEFQKREIRIEDIYRL